MFHIGQLILIGFLIQFLIVLPLPAQAQDQAWNKGRSERIRELQTKLGPAIPRATLPKNYQLLDRIFETLLSGYQKLGVVDPAYQIRFQIAVLESEEANAMIDRTGKSKKNPSFYLMVTTRLLNELFDGAIEPEQQRKAIYRLAGVLSHELSHTIDKLDPIGIEAQDKPLAQQAIELRTDLEATRILHSAGFPVNALGDALSLFPEGEEHHFLRLVESHPPSNLRQQMTHMLGTQIRYEQGMNPLTPVDSWLGLIPSLRQELAPKRLRFAKLFPFNKINSIQDFISALDALRVRQNGGPKPVSFPMTGQQLNLVILKFDDLIQNYQGDVWAENSQFITALHLITAAFNAIHLGGSFQFQIERHPQTIQNWLKDYGIKLDSTQTHAQRKETIPAYQDPRLPGLLLKVSKDYGYTVGEKTVENYRGKPTSSANKEFRSQDLFLPLAVLEKQFSKFENPENVAGDIDPNSPMVPHLLSQTLGRVDFDRLEMRFRSSPFLQNLKETLQQTKALGSSQELTWAETQYISFAKSLWDKRLNWAYHDFKKASGSLQIWNILFESFGDSGKKDFKEQIGSEFLDSIRADRGERLLRTLDNAWQTPWEASWVQVESILEMLDQGQMDEPIRLKILLSMKAEAKNPKEFTKQVQNSYQKLFLDIDLKGKSALQMQNELNSLRRQMGYGPVSHASGFPELRLIEIEMIANSAYSDAEKKIWLRQLLFEPEGPGPKPNERDCYYLFRYLVADPEFTQRALTAAQKYGAFTTALDYWNQVGERLKKYNSSFINHFIDNEQAIIANSFPIFRDMAISELNQIDFQKMNRKEAMALLRRYTYLLSFPLYIHEETRLRHEQGLKKNKRLKKYVHIGSDQLVQAIVEKFKSTKPTKSEAVTFFNFLTDITTTPGTDALYQWIRSQYGESKTSSFAKKTMKSEKIESHEIQIQETRTFLAPMVDERNIGKIDRAIVRNLRFSSLTKDEFLEDLSWRLQPKVLEGPLLRQHIDKHKTSEDWRSANVYFVNFMSSIYELTKKMSSRERGDLIKYLIHPQQVFPQTVYEFLYRQFLSDRLMSGPSSANQQTREVSQAQALTDAQKAKRLIETTAQKTSPMEKLPIVQITLSTEKDSQALKTLRDDLLGLQPGSLEEVLLESFLEVIPSHEKMTTLAYQFSQQADQNSKGLVAVFEVFSTVGIKLAQFSSVLDVFGPAKSKELETAKDSATPATLQELIQIVNKNFGGQLDEMQMKKILGGASVKVAAEVTLPSGTSAVLIVKRPGADRKVKDNLELSSRFIQVLRQKNVPGMSRLFGAIVYAMEEILKDEMDLTREVKKYQIIQQLIDNYQSSGQNQSQWKLKAPRVLTEIGVTSEAYFLEFVPGDSLSSLVRENKISAKEAEEVGKLIADFSLEIFLKYGVFDPDRHKGNFLVDLKTKTVVFIDPGQLLDFKPQKSMFQWDIRLGIAKLLESISAKDVKATIHYGLRLSNLTAIHPNKRNDLENGLKKIFAGPEDKIMLNVLDLFYDSELSFDWKITFGVIKGMVLLSQENYVSQKEFKDLMTKKIKSLYLSKLPALGLNWIRQKVGIPSASSQNGKEKAMEYPMCRRIYSM
jgi:predicted unusual protein kinase regulating ubiquinone biosynthesis (AarF/ABC1/UbiB family)